MKRDTFDYDLYKAMEEGNIFERVFHRRRVKTVLSAINYSGKKVLDLGCGTGIMLVPLLKKGVDVLGVDINPADVERAKINLARNNLPQDRVLVSDGKKLPFADREFDVVLLIDVLEHVSDPQKVAAEASRVVKKGGLVVVTVPWQYHPVVRFTWVRKLLSGRSNIDEVPDEPYSLKKLTALFPDLKLVHRRLVFFWVDILAIFKKL